MPEKNVSEKKTAGAFDIRNVIGALLGVFGIVLLLTFLIGGDSTNGSNKDNLWSGLVFLVVGLIFLAWARFNPIVVETPEGEEPKGGLK